MFSLDVNAEKNIATCVYEPESIKNDYSPSKIILTVDSKYNITFENFKFQKSWNNCEDKAGWNLTRYEKSNSYTCYNIALTEVQIDYYDFNYGDFIKAIVSEKDDEMKKAQGHFVKRLIAAALIFIVPFIIEFILDKIGFSTNGCGIIDL